MPIHKVLAGMLVVQSLSLTEIFERAKQKVEALSEQQAQINAAKAQSALVNSNFYPVVGAFFSYTRQDNPVIGGANSTATAFTNPNQILSKLTASYTGLQGFRELAAYRSAKATIRAQESTLKVLEMNLYTQVSAAYYTVLMNRQDLSDVQELLKLSEARATEIRKFVSLGRSRETDWLTQMTQAATLQAQVRQAQETLRLNENTLRILTGMGPDDEAATDPKELPVTLEPIADYLSKIDRRPDIKSLQAQIDAAEENTHVAFAGHFPTIGLLADYYPYRTGILQNVNWDLGLTINIPLFQGFGVTAQVDQNRSQARSLHYALLQAKRDAERQIRSNYDNLKSVIDTLPLYKKALQLAKKSYDQQLSDYQRKLNTNLDVNQALIQYATLVRTYDSTHYQGKAALEALHASIGQFP